MVQPSKNGKHQTKGKANGKLPVKTTPASTQKGAEARAQLQEIADGLRRAKVSELYLAGYTPTEIAARLGESYPTIGKDLTWLKDQWREHSTIPFEQQLAEELARLQRLERIANEALASSRMGTTKKRNVNKMVLGIKRGKGVDVSDDEEKEEVAYQSNKGRGKSGKGMSKSAQMKKGGVEKESAQGGNGKPEMTGEVRPVESSEEHTTSAGDPRWARQVQDVIELRAKLLGLIGGDVVNNNTNVTLDWQTLITSGGNSAHVSESAQGQLPSQMNGRISVNGTIVDGKAIPPQLLHDARDPIEQRINAINPVPGLQSVANAEGFPIPSDTTDPKERIQPRRNREEEEDD